jgi:hypothetical protein
MQSASTVFSTLFSILVSVVFLFTLDPENGSCSMNTYISAAQYATFILVPFVIWSFLSNGSISRYRLTALSCWSKITKQTNAELGDGLIAPFRNNCEENSMVSQVFNLFYDRWVLVALVDVLFVFLVKFRATGYSTRMNNSSDLISTFCQVWASSMLFNETIELFRGRHPVIAEQWIFSYVPQIVLIWVSLALSVVLIFILSFGADSTAGGEGFIFFSLALRFTIHVYQLLSFCSLISVIDKFGSDLLEAVVTSSSLHQAPENRLDFPFRSNSDTSTLRRSAIANPSLSVCSTENIKDEDKTNVLSITSSLPESVVMKGPRSDYSQIYKECDKIADVLKMLATLIFINTVFDVAAFITSVTVNFSGNTILTQTLKLTMFLLPWIYLAGYRMSSPACAVASARKGCVVLLVLTAYVVTTVIGGYLGCTFLTANTFFGNKGKQFLLYLAKASAIPTTVSIAFAALSSPGVRGWNTLPPYTAYFMVPLIWMPPFVMQELHEASGANFLLMGSVHTFAWIIMVGIGMFDLSQPGVLFATLTGFLMLVFGVKLLWPPGRSIPFVTAESSRLYKRLDAFLRDSKYGSYHIYFALTTMSLFVVHGILKIQFSYSWYFLFLIFAVIIMVSAHPVKRYHTQRMLYTVVGSDSEKYEILSKTTTQIRGKGLVAVELTLSLPKSVNLASLQGCGDVISIQNLAREKASRWLSKFYRTLETAHYFSVVSIHLLPNPNDPTHLPTARVTLMIQKTSRSDGASTALVEDDDDSGTILHEVRVLGFMKSNSLEALYSPCLIAFGYESGSAAFCSMMKERMRMRAVVESSSKRIKPSELTDLCVIWCQFMRKPRGRALRVDDIVLALKELSAMQEFLYSNSGGRGVKMLFVCTGVPAEWTPDPECISHRSVMMETEVATAFAAKDVDVTRPSWFSPPLSLVSGEYNPHNANHIDNPAIRPSQSRLSSVNGVLRGSIINFADTWGRTSSLESGDNHASVAARKSSANNRASRRFSLGGSGGLKSIQEEESKSDKAGDGMELPTADSTVPLSRVQGPERHDGEGGSSQREISPTLTPFSNLTPPGISDSTAASKQLHKAASKDDIESQTSPTHYSPPPHAAIEKREEFRRDVRRSSLFSVPHHFVGSQQYRQRFPVETLVNIQTKEESWVPLRHALGSNWKTFCNTLDYRVGSAVHWLNHPGGPDYTSLFITEHQSDVPILRDFKYSEVYDGKHQFWLFVLSRKLVFIV